MRGRRAARLAPIAMLALVWALAPATASGYPVGAVKAADLFAGQTVDVGDVYVWNDATYLYVEYVLDPAWCMTESHLAVDDVLTDIPQRNGNPTPGRFDYGDAYDPCASGDTFPIPLSGLGTDPYIAAHAKVWEIGPGAPTASVTEVSNAGDMVYGPNPEYDPPGSSDYGGAKAAVVPSFVTTNPSTWPSITGAQWISTEAIETTTPVPDTWRWHRATLNVPGPPVAGSVMAVTSDNAERVWLNGAMIGSDGEVDVPYTDNQEWNTVQSYPFTPVLGTNTLDFVWRNYGSCPSGSAFCSAPGLQLTPAENPNGLIYSATVTYYSHSESAWGGAAQGVQPFPGSNWATYFGYGVQAYVVGDTTASTAFGLVDLNFEVWGGATVSGTTSWVRTIANPNWWEGPVVAATISATTASFTVRVASGTPSGIDGCDITIAVVEGGAGTGTWQITAVVNSPAETCPYAGQVQGPWTITAGSIDVFTT